MAQPGQQVPRRPFGRTGLEVSIMGVGGYHLGSANDRSKAQRIVDEAIDAGINLFDNAWDYHDAAVRSGSGRR